MSLPKVAERFLRYVKTDTQSDYFSTSVPSTSKQFVLAKMLAEELTNMGLSQVSLDEHGYLMATLPANTKEKVPVIGFIAHLDTSPDISGAYVKPQIIPAYQGGEIALPLAENTTLSPEISPEITQYTGQTLITTSGDTLLGADDKAGIAEILTALEYLIQNPGISHGTIRVAFTPDEEIGNGANFFDVAKFGANYAYTVDGGALGELEYENFNAATADFSISGKNFHPGYAKNKMINALHLAMEIDRQLPPGEKPENTEGTEGFFFLQNLTGTVENCTAHYLIRDHYKNSFENRKNLLAAIAASLNQKYGHNTVKLQITDQYFNMKEVIEPHFEVVDIASKAMELCNIKPIIRPIRGGTDGARISFMGIPCPNLFTGGHNAHGRWEYIPVESMEKAVEVLVKICELYANFPFPKK